MYFFTCRCFIECVPWKEKWHFLLFCPKNEFGVKWGVCKLALNVTGGAVLDVRSDGTQIRYSYTHHSIWNGFSFKLSLTRKLNYLKRNPKLSANSMEVKLQSEYRMPKIWKHLNSGVLLVPIIRLGIHKVFYMRLGVPFKYQT